MMPVEKLPEAAEKVLSGLTADASLKQRVYAAAAGADSGRSRFSPARMVTVSCCLALAVAFAFVGVRGLQEKKEAEVAFQAFSSASHTSSSPVFLQQYLNP